MSPAFLPVTRPRCGVLLMLGLVWLAAGVPALRAQEVRALWVDGFHAGLRTPAEVARLVEDARAANFNTLLVEVRRRGDALYESRFEPKADDVSPHGYDPLADVIARAHATNAGPRLEIHAWIVTYKVWNRETVPPSQRNHPYRLHPEWLTRSADGAKWDGNDYSFDPALPSVQRHVYDVAMDLVSRYDLDGLHLDYIRYPGNEWGYHPVAVARFNQLANRKGKPAPNDPAWLQFRRDQVTALVRKICLGALERKPMLKLSAATIAWAPGPAAATDWPASAAYSDVLQDWRAWIAEGLLDMNVPMTYFRHHTARSNDWSTWARFLKDHRGDRQLVLGVGAFLNPVAGSLAQVRSTRIPTASGHLADGVAVFSYAQPGLSNAVPRAELLTALAQPGRHEPGVPLFAAPAQPPEMPWKTAPTAGHLFGSVANARGDLLADAAVVIEGPVRRVVRTDATGFLGAVGLPPGEYTCSDARTGARLHAEPFEVAVGKVTRVELKPLPPAPPVAAPPVASAMDPSRIPSRSATNAPSVEPVLEWPDPLACDGGLRP